MKSISQRFKEIRQQTETLVSTLRPEDFVVQPIADVSPPKWHLAHSSWFFEQLILVPYCDNYTVFDADYNYLFNSYYESVGKRILRVNRGNLTRPGVEEVFKFRKYVDENMLSWMASTDISQPVVDLIELGLQHEQQHQELLVTDIKYILGNNPLFPEYTPRVANKILKQAKKAEFVSVTGGLREVGFTGDGFHFDNEKGCHQVFIQPFKFMNRLVTNEEYLEFMAAGGYSDFRHWLMEGWEWVKASQIESPQYWYKQDNEWFQYTLNGLVKLDPHQPVTHVSYYEADAYASWKDMRLLSEFEWETAAKQFEPAINGHCNFVESNQFQPVASGNGNFQLLGDTWEWTQSAYLPYPYFKKAPGAVGEYNGKFMVNQKVLRGGSCATPANHIRHTYRNFFHPHLRWQFTGIRLAAYI